MNYLKRSLRLMGVGLKNSVTANTKKLVEFPMVQFNNPDSLKECIVRSDKEIGGYSSAHLDWEAKQSCAHFHGTLSLDLPAGRPEVQRSGYAMFRTKDRPKNFMDEDIYWDLETLSHIALRVKGDRRKYFVNIQSKTSLPTEIHQHRLFLYNPGEWEVAVIPLKHFLLTNWGRVEAVQEVNRSKLKTVGIGLLDRRYGPFSLYVDWIKAISDDEAERLIAQARVEAQQRGMDIPEQRATDPEKAKTMEL
ncbi:complex I intermediate-associated protein 30-domain-containing protein [Limtongia smithiae]|uniref:complex I intermediate-associated protein 30-domain-containing protein n=1 Tax=Limtongia smithiae TaxID=1125753 RepID=UPI0034CED521